MRESHAIWEQSHAHVHILLVRRITRVDVKNSTTGTPRGEDRMLFLKDPQYLQGAPIAVFLSTLFPATACIRCMRSPHLGRSTSDDSKWVLGAIGAAKIEMREA